MVSGMHRAHRRRSPRCSSVTALATTAASAQAAPGTLGSVNIPGLSNLNSPAATDVQSRADLPRRCTPVSCASISRGRCSSRTGRRSTRPRSRAPTACWRDTSAAGIKVVATVASTPCWASSTPASAQTGFCATGNSEQRRVVAAQRPRDVCGLPEQRVARCSTKITAIEVWNEPDQSNEDYFAGPNKAQHYAAVVRAAYPAVKAAEPRACWCSPARSSARNGNFLRALYAAGMKGYYDGLSGPLLHASRSPRCAPDPTKPRWRTATPSRSGSTSSGMEQPAGRGARTSSRNRHASHRRPKRSTCGTLGSARTWRQAARYVEQRPRWSTSSRTRTAKTSARSRRAAPASPPSARSAKPSSNAVRPLQPREA